MIVELINPSDSYTLESDDLEALSLANIILGRGKTGLSQLDGDRSWSMPIMIFGGADEWCLKMFGIDLNGLLSRVDKPRIAKVLRSIFPGGATDRMIFSKLTPEERAEFADKKRSSMNDYFTHANSVADNLEKPAQQPGEEA